MRRTGKAAGAAIVALTAVGAAVVAPERIGALARSGVPDWEVEVEASPTAVFEEKWWQMQMVAVAPDGSFRRCLLSEPQVWYGQAAVSPDRKWLAYSAASYQRPSDEGGATTALYIARVEADRNGVPRSLSDIEEVYSLKGLGLPGGAPSWSMDSRRMAVSLACGACHTGPKNDLFVADVDAGEVANITGTGAVSESAPAFSPTSRKIAFSRWVKDRGRRAQDIFVATPSGKAPRRVTHPGNSPAGNLTCPEWSADGRTIQFQDRFTAKVYRVAADGTGRSREVSGDAVAGFAQR